MSHRVFLFERRRGSTRSLHHRHPPRSRRVYCQSENCSLTRFDCWVLGRADHFEPVSERPGVPADEGGPLLDVRLSPDVPATGLSGEMSSKTARWRHWRAYRAGPRSAVGVLASPPDLNALALLPGEDAEGLTSCSQSDPAGDERGFARADEAGPRAQPPRAGVARL
jgi:hypothetical protein